jgi:hypothetical protein
MVAEVVSRKDPNMVMTRELLRRIIRVANLENVQDRPARIARNIVEPDALAQVVK